MNKKGFTLIELLVVIAIIGILSSIALVNLNTARQKAKTASAQGTLASIVGAATICINDGIEVAGLGGAACPGTGVPLGGTTPICVGGTDKWPTLPPDWLYTACASDQAAGTFSFGATDGTDTISCTNIGC